MILLLGCVVPPQRMVEMVESPVVGDDTTGVLLDACPDASGVDGANGLGCPLDTGPGTGTPAGGVQGRSGGRCVLQQA